MQKFTVEFSNDAITALDKLKTRLAKRSRADVLRTALLLLEFLLAEKDSGKSITIHCRNKDEKKIVELIM